MGVNRLVGMLVSPYVLLHLLLGLGIVLLWWRCRSHRKWIVLPTFAWIALFLLSTRLVSYALLGSLEWSYPPREDDVTDAQAIVVLSGDYYPPDSVRRYAEPGPFTMGRCRHAARVYHANGRVPVIVTGGKVKESTAGPGCAEVMKDLLVEWGVDRTDIIVEGVSRSTYENAVQTRKELDRLGYQKIALVTDASHMPRAVQCFHKQGIETVPASCGHRATELHGPFFDHVIPSAKSVEHCQIAIHEWVGMVWYRIKGRI